MLSGIVSLSSFLVLIAFLLLLALLVGKAWAALFPSHRLSLAYLGRDRQLWRIFWLLAGAALMLSGIGYFLIALFFSLLAGKAAVVLPRAAFISALLLIAGWLCVRFSQRFSRPSPTNRALTRAASNGSIRRTEDSDGQHFP